MSSRASSANGPGLRRDEACLSLGCLSACER
jgi:hypothetical protein